MRIEKIRFNKIKVTFSVEDLILHGLTPEAVRQNAPAAQEVFWSVLKQAEEETGFCAEDGRLMIEARSCPDDSLVLYITKLDSDEDIKVPLHPAKKRAKMRIRAVDSSASNGESCLVFDSIEDVIALANSSLDISGGELYFYRDKYYLIISSESEAQCSEFGKSVSSPYMASVLREHGKFLCGDAAEVLRKNFRDAE